MGRGCRMNGKTPCITDIRYMITKFEGIDKFFPGLDSFFELQHHQYTESSIKILFRPFTNHPVIIFGVDDSFHLWMIFEKIDNPFRVGAVLAHS